jgi:hypothetical protein
VAAVAVETAMIEWVALNNVALHQPQYHNHPPVSYFNSTINCETLCILMKDKKTTLKINKKIN